MGGRPFLTAHWENLAIVSYGVDDAPLLPHLPPGLELDRRDGSAFVSLVAFDFRDTRVFGLRWPGCVTFPEVNLRFYLRDPATGRRGVCFIRELVQPRPVVWIARWVYNEPYARARMSSVARTTGDSLRVEHRWSRDGVEHALDVESAASATRPPADSEAHWFKEHEWGFGRDRRGTPVVYRVEHPVWETHPVRSADVRVNFGALYGPDWAALTGRTPDSIVLAAGSAVRVFPRL